MTLNKIISGVLAFMTAFVLMFTVVTPTLAQVKMVRDTHKNCISAKFSKEKELRVSVDSESGFVTVEDVDENGSPMETLLNFKGEDKKNSFIGCSEDSRKLLSEINKIEAKYNSDICSQMKDVLNGKKPLPIMGDVKPTMDDVKIYIKSSC